MPARSKAQQKAAGAALAAKRGEISPRKLKGASRQMVSSMTEGQLEELASTKRKKLPGRASGKGNKKTAAKKSRSTGRSRR